jgi:hypothetical protein
MNVRKGSSIASMADTTGNAGVTFNTSGEWIERLNK